MTTPCTLGDVGVGHSIWPTAPGVHEVVTGCASRQTPFGEGNPFALVRKGRFGFTPKRGR